MKLNILSSLVFAVALTVCASSNSVQAKKKKKGSDDDDAKSLPSGIISTALDAVDAQTKNPTDKRRILNLLETKRAYPIPTKREVNSCRRKVMIRVIS